MTSSPFPVFWKDVRSLLKLMKAFLVMQAFWILMLLLVFWYWERSLVPFSAFAEIMVLSAIALGQIFGLVAGGYVFAEEATDGTDVFLSRLPASRARITAEKLAAGLAAVALLLLIEAAFHVIALPFGGLWSGGPSEVGIVEDAMSWITSPATVAVTLLLFGFGSYLVSVLVSLLTKQTLVIVVAGYSLETIVYGFVMMGVDDALWVSWEMAWLNMLVYAPLLLVPLLVVVPGTRLRIPGAASIFALGRAPIRGLVWKSITENATLQVLSLTFLLTAFIVPGEVDAALVTGVALLLLVALGTASYSPVEKQGLDCVLYQHPVPRNHLFWAKTGAAVVPVLAVAAGTLIFWSREAPPDVVTALAYAGFAYTCAVLMALTFERPIIALLATVSVIVMSLLIPMIYFEFVQPVRNVEVTRFGVEVYFRPGGVPGAELSVVFLSLAVPAVVLFSLAVGLALIGLKNKDQVLAPLKPLFDALTSIATVS